MVSRETASEKELYEYISKQNTLKEMLEGMRSGDIEITTCLLYTSDAADE